MTGALGRVVAGLLGVAIALGAAAWRLQWEAATALQEAVRVQGSTVPEPADSPTSLEEYREVVRALQESILLRGRIDGVLGRVEGMLATLTGHQEDAATVTAAAEEQLEQIARTLGGAERATGVSVERLGELAGRLETTDRLAELIADELEELDRSLGPSAGGLP